MCVCVHLHVCLPLTSSLPLPSDRGEGDMWMSMVYPGMKQAIIHSLLVVQDEVEHRKVSRLLVTPQEAYTLMSCGPGFTSTIKGLTPNSKSLNY